MSDAATIAPAKSDPRTCRNVAVLVAAQAILGSQMPMLFVVGGLVGNALTPNPYLATLPISLIVFGSMTTALWISPLMQRRGRQTGFIIGALAGATGALVAGIGLYLGSFLLLLLGSYISGIYMSAQGFYRFAAADGASDQFRAKAISYVMAGGLMSAIIGPQLNKFMFDFSVIPFLGSYVAIVVLNLAGLFLFFLLDLPNAAAMAAARSDAPVRSKMQLLKTPRVAVAVICGMVSYALMNLVMTSTPLAVMGCGFSSDDANDIVSAHVLAMFIPSFFTGHLINRFGVEKIVAAGLVILGLAGVVALTGVTLENFFIALILLGFGWNFGFIGATTMLASSHTTAERGVVQGMNDSIVFGCVTLASLASGGLINSGADAAQGWSSVNIAMIPFLTLAGAALIWLALRPKDAAPS
ncbi:MAG: MFS transporter [Litoreibacter sp.]|uniref:MFS transporter n=1 Tax=Litoreibacter sp. TaxID=1969459 RepID=UPI003298F664